MREADRKNSLPAVNLSVVLFGLSGLFAKWVSLPAIGITFGRVFFSFAALFVWQVSRGQSLKLDGKRDLLYLALAGGILALHWWSFLEAIKVSSVAIGTITFSSYPLFVVFLEPFVFHKRLGAGDVIAAAIILMGVCITVPELYFENEQLFGWAIGMVSALCYAILTVCNKGFSERYNGTKIAFYEQAVACIVLAPFVFTTGINPGFKDVALVAALGIFMTALAHTLFISGLKGISAYLAGICSSMETVYSIIFAFLLLGEVPSLREILGAAVIICVVVFMQVNKSNLTA